MTIFLLLRKIPCTSEAGVPSSVRLLGLPRVRTAHACWRLLPRTGDWRFACTSSVPPWAVGPPKEEGPILPIICTLCGTSPRLVPK